MQNSEIKDLAKQAIKDVDHWLLHAIIGTKNAIAFQQVLVSTLLLKYNILTTQKAVEDVATKIIEAPQDAEIEQFIEEERYSLRNQVLIGNSDSRAVFYSNHCREVAKGVKNDAQGKSFNLISDNTEATSLDIILKNQEKHLDHFQSCKEWATSTTVGEFSKLGKEDFVEIFNGLMDEAAYEEKSANLKKEEIDEKKKEYNKQLIEIVDTLNEIQSGELSEQLHTTLIDKAVKTISSKKNSPIYGDFYSHIKVWGEDKVKKIFKDKLRITETVDLTDLLKLAEEKGQNNCILVLLANCVDISNMVNTTALQEMMKKEPDYITFFSLYEPLFEKLVNVDKCFLSFNEVGKIIPKDTEKVFYEMHKKIKQCEEWTKNYILCTDPKTKEETSWKEAEIRWKKAKKEGCYYPETKSVMSWKTGSHKFRASSIGYFILMGPNSKSLKSYVKERGEEIEEYSDLFNQHFVPNDVGGFLEKACEFKESEKRKDVTGAWFSGMNSALKKALKDMSEVPNEEFKKKYGLKSVKMNEWYSANNHMKKDYEVKLKEANSRTRASDIRAEEERRAQAAAETRARAEEEVRRNAEEMCLQQTEELQKQAEEMAELRRQLAQARPSSELVGATGYSECIKSASVLFILLGLATEIQNKLYTR